MSTIDPTQQDEAREPVLDTVNRVSELCVGLLMALSIVNAVSATAGEDARQRMFHTALSCNLAWGFADGVMFLVRTLTDRGRRLTLAQSVRNATDASAGVRLLRDALPKPLKALVADAELDGIRERITATTTLPKRPHLKWTDFLGAAAIFAIVFLSAIPVTLPFILLSDAQTALLISRALAFAMLFACGAALGRNAGYGGWKAGFEMVVIGVGLTMAIIASSE